MKWYHVYIMSNKGRTVFYTGVTNNVARRREEHREEGDEDGFCGKYNIVDVIYIEDFRYITEAIRREKRLKRWRRSEKLNLIKSVNPTLASLEPPYFTLSSP